MKKRFLSVYFTISFCFLASLSFAFAAQNIQEGECGIRFQPPAIRAEDYTFKYAAIFLGDNLSIKKEFCPTSLTARTTQLPLISGLLRIEVPGTNPRQYREEMAGRACAIPGDPVLSLIYYRDDRAADSKQKLDQARGKTTLLAAVDCKKVFESFIPDEYRRDSLPQLQAERRALVEQIRGDRTITCETSPRFWGSPEPIRTGDCRAKWEAVDAVDRRVTSANERMAKDLQKRNYNSTCELVTPADVEKLKDKNKPKYACARLKDACKSYDEALARKMDEQCKRLPDRPSNATECRAANGFWHPGGDHTTEQYCEVCPADQRPGQNGCVPKTAENQQDCNNKNGVWHETNDGRPATTCEFCSAGMRANQAQKRCEPDTSDRPCGDEATMVSGQCRCTDSTKTYVPATKTCTTTPPPAEGEAQCHARGNAYIFTSGSCVQCPKGLRKDGNTCGCFAGYREEPGKCVPDSQQPQPDPTCRGGLRKADGQCCQRVDFSSNRCLDADATPQPRPGDRCVVQGTNDEGTLGSDGRTCEVRRCSPNCPTGQQCVSGRCQAQQITCQQGQIQQGNQCVIDQRNQQTEEQRCMQQGGEMIQGRCFARRPNQQQQQQQPQPQQQGGMTPQQQQQIQQLQAMQECQMRQPQGAWQWNGFQCMPNPNYRPQGYGAPASVTGGVVCNFFGSDSLEVPAGEKFSVTYDVSGARREIKVDTSPKSTTQYTRQPTTSATTNSLMNQYGYANQDPYSLTTGAVAAPTSVQGQATITAPKKKGKLKVSLVIDAVRQNSEACKPIEITISESVPQSTTSTSDYSGSDSTPSSYASDSQPLDSGQVIETPSEIIAQNRRTVSAKQQPVETAPADDDAYAYLCKTLGIGCAKDAPTLSETPRIRDLQVKTNPSNEITIDPDAEDPADLPNIGEPQNGEQTTNGPVQNIATDIGIDGDGKNVKHSAVLDYLSDNGQYAPPIGPNSDKSGVLNSSDDTSGGTAENRVGIFTRLWRWFLNLLGFGPEYVG